MKKLLIATTNPGKLADLKKFLSDVPLELVSFKDLQISEKVAETGKTFKENALIKARFYCRITHLPTLADDGGLEIDALGGEPGVASHRWLDPTRESNDEALIQYTLKRLKGVPLEKRGAQLKLVIALALPDGRESTAGGVIRGIIPPTPATHRTKGYPYRSLLFIPATGKFYDHSVMSDKEIKLYDHRRKAVAKLKPRIKKLL